MTPYILLLSHNQKLIMIIIINITNYIKWPYYTVSHFIVAK